MTKSQPPVVVGYDGTEGADAALDWAAAEAALRNLPLRIVYAAAFAPQSEHLHMFDELPEPLVSEGQRLVIGLLERAKHAAERAAPGLTVTTASTSAHRAAHVLVHETQNATMVVLGSRHLGALGSAFLGSVGSAVAQRSACPVIILRGPAGHAAEGARVVVGVDGRHLSDAMLQFAFEHADTRSLPLQAVLCWPPDPLAEMGWRPQPSAPDKALALVAEAVAGWRDKFPDVDVHTAVVRELPTAGLVAAATAQDILVVGRRGRGVVPGVVMGSTSLGVLHHATCPVAIVPEF